MEQESEADTDGVSRANNPARGNLVSAVRELATAIRESGKATPSSSLLKRLLSHWLSVIGGAVMIAGVLAFPYIRDRLSGPQRHVVIEPISVPQTLIDRGFTGEAAARMLRTRLQALQADLERAQDEQHSDPGSGLRTEGSKEASRARTALSRISQLDLDKISRLDFDLPVVGLTYQGLQRWLEAEFGGSPTTIGGDLMIVDGAVLFYPHVNNTALPVEPIRADLGDLAGFAAGAAETLLPVLVEYEGPTNTERYDVRHVVLSLHYRALRAMNAGEFYQALKYFESAAAHGQAILTTKQDAELFNNWGFALYSLGRNTDAISKYHTATALNSDLEIAHFNKGATNNELRNFEPAAIDLQNALRLVPGDAFTHAELWAAYSGLGDETSASAHLGIVRQALLQPDKVIASILARRMGYLARRLGQPKLAEEYHRKAWELIPAEPGVLLAHGETLLANRKYREAENQFQQALALAPTDVSAQLGLAMTKRKQHRYGTALEIIERIVTSDPDMYWALIEKCRVLADLRRMTAAEAYCLKATQERPNAPFGWSAWGYVLLSQRQHEAAIEKFQRALAEEPRDTEAAVGWGWALIHMHRYEEAMARFQVAARVDPTSPWPFEGIAHAALQINDYDAAQAAADKMSEIDPGSGEALTYSGWIQSRLGCFRGAEAFNKAAIDLDPEHLWGWIDLAENRARAANSEAAIGVYETVAQRLASVPATIGLRLAGPSQRDIALHLGQSAFANTVSRNPASADLYMSWGSWLLDEGRPSEAAERLRMAVGMDAYNLDAKVNLAAALAAQGRHQEALALADAAVGLDAYSGGAWLAKARALAGTGLAEQALEALETATRLEESNAELWLQTGDVLRELGDRSGASVAYRRAATLDRRGIIGRRGALADRELWGDWLWPLSLVLPISYYESVPTCAGEPSVTQ